MMWCEESHNRLQVAEQFSTLIESNLIYRLVIDIYLPVEISDILIEKSACTDRVTAESRY